MRRLYLALAIVLVLAGWGEAQTPAPLTVIDYPTVPTLNIPTAAVESRTCCDDVQLWSVNFLLGAPTGIRFQRALGEDRGRDWLIEGFVGAELIFPMAGGGIRRRFTPFRGQRDCLMINPGVDVYVLYNTLHSSAGLLGGGRVASGLIAADVEILWHHAFNDRCGGQFGICLGAGTGFPGHSLVLPMTSLIFGLRF